MNKMRTSTTRAHWHWKYFYICKTSQLQFSMYVSYIYKKVFLFNKAVLTWKFYNDCVIAFSQCFVMNQSSRQVRRAIFVRRCVGVYKFYMDLLNLFIFLYALCFSLRIFVSKPFWIRLKIIFTLSMDSNMLLKKSLVWFVIIRNSRAKRLCIVDWTNYRWRYNSRWRAILQIYKIKIENARWRW